MSLIEKLIKARETMGLSQSDVATWYTKRTRIPSRIDPIWLNEIETYQRKPYQEEVSLLMECYSTVWGSIGE